MAIRSLPPEDSLQQSDLQLYSIHIFDDGNEPFKRYENKWELVHDAKLRTGKVKLVNHEDPLIVIPSISEWKVVKYDARTVGRFVVS